MSGPQYTRLVYFYPSPQQVDTVPEIEGNNYRNQRKEDEFINDSPWAVSDSSLVFVFKTS